MLQWRMDVSAWELFNPKLQFQRLETFRWWGGWVFKDLPKGWSLEIPPFPRVLRLSSSWDMAQPFPPAARLFGCENVPHQNRGPLGTCSSKAMRLASTKTMRSWTFVGIKDARCFQDVPMTLMKTSAVPDFLSPKIGSTLIGGFSLINQMHFLHVNFLEIVATILEDDTKIMVFRKRTSRELLSMCSSLSSHQTGWKKKFHGSPQSWACPMM